MAAERKPATHRDHIIDLDRYAAGGLCIHTCPNEPLASFGAKAITTLRHGCDHPDLRAVITRFETDQLRSEIAAFDTTAVDISRIQLRAKAV